MDETAEQVEPHCILPFGVTQGRLTQPHHKISLSLGHRGEGGRVNSCLCAPTNTIISMPFKRQLSTNQPAPFAYLYIVNLNLLCMTNVIFIYNGGFAVCVSWHLRGSWEQLCVTQWLPGPFSVHGGVSATVAQVTQTA